MKIKIINTQKLKEKYVKSTIQEYTKRLSAYCKVEYVETKNPAKEISFKSYVIKIKKEGEELSSEQLAEKIEQLGVSGNSNITILLGADNIEADCVLSISRMDIDINILLIIICEQIYRAYRIINNAPYHK
ncbi:23S rRNA (pseudouridine(1915)-N(3))-methyltransferase RlmH [Tepidimicrobium xylanilyticum]|uniref:23S rRNA (pseudouridine(1915)-N(3))-methyltransferase RlmH n=1 Tax=Tepidimicrobium xylanilyticum TaxID=1123352 RepID=UPI0026527571|nr:23S rRNA (pseudouridine(1915)-N(3))-methyltransferase RlmH [Tepidimicrobium xylanilyticum]GMG97597.1 ribosomal RNA large subunit methyltransferase H [Tepidimicrobium xylanilyticum]